MKRTAFLLGFAIAFIGPVTAQISLTGVTLWMADATGAKGVGYWDTVEGVYGNVYLFTGTTGAPVFVNSGNTNASLNPNLALPPGSTQLQFAANSFGASFTGINLYFNGDLATPRISAFVANDGSTAFAVIANTTNTWGEQLADTPGSGALNYVTGGYQVTLAALSVPAPGAVNIVSNFSTGGADAYDTVGSMTLIVAAVPEPAAAAVWAGLLVLCWAGRRSAQACRSKSRPE